MIHHEGKPDLETLDALFDIPILKPLSYEDRYVIQSEARFISYEPGEKVIGFEDETTDVFFIVRGSVDFFVRSIVGSNIPFGSLGTGQYFGELSTIDDGPQIALVYANQPCMIAALNAGIFHDAVLSNSDSARQLLRDLVFTIRNSTARIVKVGAQGSGPLGNDQVPSEPEY